MKKGFTLVELLGVLTLLALLSILIFPTVLEMVEKNQGKIDQGKFDLIVSAADKYMNEHLDLYPETPGNVYCIPIQTLADEHLLLFEADDQILYVDDAKTKLNQIRIAIGEKNKNAYQIPKDGVCQEQLSIVNASSYVQKGLVAQFDGSVAPVNGTWRNLVGPQQATLNSFSSGGYSGNHITFPTANAFISFENPLTDQTQKKQSYTVSMTIKINTAISGSMITGINSGLSINWGSTGKGLHYINSGENDHYVYSKGPIPTNQLLQLTFTLEKDVDQGIYSIDFYQDDKSISARNMVGERYASRLAHGMDPTIQLKLYGVELYDLQIYDRVLTETERNRNHFISKERYHY